MTKSKKINEGVEKNRKDSKKYAGFWIRFAAFAIDLFIAVIIGVVASIALEVLAEIAGISHIMPIAEKYIGTIVIWSYFIYLTYNFNATFGKKLVGIEVISSKKENINLGQIIFRETVGKIVSFVVLGLGFLIVGYDKKKLGFHDRIGRTMVMRKEEKLSKNQKIIYYSTLVLIGLTSVVIVFGGLTWLFRMSAARIEARTPHRYHTLRRCCVRGSVH